MLITFIFNILISSVILGYSYFFKIVLLNQRDEKIKNLDFVYGIFFLSFLTIFFNFFLPIYKIKFFILIIGLLFFLFAFINNKINVNTKSFLFFLFFFSFFTYWNGNNVDSPVYHIQTIKWIHDYKITFGLAILDWHYALNSIWHVLLSVLSFQYKNFNTLYVVSFIPLSFMLSESLNIKKKLSISNLSIFFSSIYILFFSFIHPYQNGIMFNHLGNPEVDIMGMVFFIFAVYNFLKFIESKNKNYFKLLIIYSIMCPLIKFTYVGSLLLPIIALFFHKLNIKILFEKISWIGVTLVFFWSIRHFILSSCFLFPVSFTCFKTSWSLSNDQVLFYLNQTKSFARDTRLRAKYGDFEHTIYSNDWFIPWVKDYLLNDAFLKISISLMIASLSVCLFHIIRKYLKLKIIKVEKLIYYILFLYFINLYIWFQAPEIRFGWGILIIFPCVILSLSILELKILKKINGNIYTISIFILCILIMNKNFHKFNTSNLNVEFVKKFNYSKIVEYGNYNNFKIFRSMNWQCADFKSICINKPKKSYYLENRKNYIFINTSDRETY